MPKQKKTLPDLHSLISGAPAPDAPTEPENHQASEPENQETGEPDSQLTAEPENVEPAKPDNITPAKPENLTPGETATQRTKKPPKRQAGKLPPVQVCVWIDPAVAGMIDQVRGALAARIPKRPTRSKLVETILREALNDIDALIDLLYQARTK